MLGNLRFEAEPTREPVASAATARDAEQYAQPGSAARVGGDSDPVRPAYEVRDPKDGKLLAAIYADGRPPIGLPLGCTINRIPLLVATARAEGAGLRK